MHQIHEINTIDQFYSFQNYWNEVLSSTEEYNLFLTWEQIAVSIKNLTKNQSLRILYITKSDNIVAIAPLRQSYYDLPGGFKYSVIEPLDYGTSTDYTGLIFAEQKIEYFRIFLSYLYRQNKWDYIYLNDIPQKSITAYLLLKNNSLYPNFRIEKGAICPFIELPDSIAKFLKGYSRNFRKNLQRRLRTLQRDYGQVELREYRDLGSLKDSMNLFFDLHQKRWLSRKEPGAFSSQKTRKIFLDRAELFAKKGWFGLYFLLVDRKPVAAKYVLEYDRKMYGCLSGFDPVYSSYGIGSLLLLKVIEKCIEKKYSIYDFMKGNEVYKFKWTRKYRRNLNINFYHNRIRSRVIAVGLEAKRKVNGLSRTILG